MKKKQINLFNQFIRVIDSLEKQNVDYVLIGGFAVVLYGMPRTTRDIDLFIRPDDENVKRLVAALNDVFHDESVQEISLTELEKYPVIRFGTDEGFNVDILIKIGNVFSFDDLDFQILDVEGHRIKTATPQTLYKMKRDTVRPEDKADSLFLKEWIESNLKRKA